jgi:hypothetical protein
MRRLLSSSNRSPLKQFQFCPPEGDGRDAAASRRARAKRDASAEFEGADVPRAARSASTA